MNRIGNLLTVSGISVLGTLTFPSPVVCMCRLVIGLLLILCRPLRATLVFTRCRTLTMLAWAGPTLMRLSISLEFLVTDVVIRKNVDDETLFGILTRAVASPRLDLIDVAVLLMSIGQLKLCSTCLARL